MRTKCGTRTSSPEPAIYKLEDVATSACRFLRSTPSYAGELPALKVGGRGVWRVDKHDLDGYLEQLKEQTAAWAKKHPLNPRDKGNGSEPD